MANWTDPVRPRFRGTRCPVAQGGTVSCTRPAPKRSLAAEGRRRCPQRASAVAVHLLQRLHRRRAEHTGHADLRRGAPDPGDEHQPVHPGRGAGCRQAAGAGADRGGPDAGFLLDEHQVVRPGEMGTELEIRTEPEQAGCRVDVVRLEDQFRRGGSQLYEQWVLRLLGLDPREPIAWSELARGSDETYRVAAMPTPRALESWLVGQNRAARTPPESPRVLLESGATPRSSTAANTWSTTS